MKTLVAWMVAGLASAAGAQPGHWDMSDDFSTAQNPNGVWSYNVGGAPISSPGSAGNCAGWTPHPLFDGSILIALGPPSWGVFHDWQAGDVTIHPYAWMLGGQTVFSNVTWRSPFAGTINVSGRAWDAAFYPDRDASWALLVDGEVIAQRGTVVGMFRNDPGAALADNVLPGRSLSGLAVAPDDIVEFRAIATTPFGHFVGVELVIDRGCYPDCNGDGLLNLADFGCFQTKFAMGGSYADCNGDGLFNLADFGCFQTKFAVGCP